MNREHRDKVIADEQKAVDHAYHHLARAQSTVRDLAQRPTGASAKDNAAQRKEFERRLDDFQLDSDGLVFMRADVEEDDGPETFYIGRMGVTDEERNRLVLKWTAPSAVRWRSVRAESPGPVRLRRRLKCQEGRVLDYFDEIGWPKQDSDGPSPKAVADLVTRRRAAEQEDMVDPFLLQELNRAREGLMRDIVETIQRDQLELVSDERPGALVVQGGPGTGKTAVGLHRVTWLLDNEHVKADQILVVGPHAEFLTYVGRVLPALGTRGVRTRAVEGLWSGEVRAEDTADRARIKSDARMAEVLERAARAQIRPEAVAALLTDGRFTFQDESRHITVAGGELESLAEQARQRSGTNADRRQYFVDSLLDHLIKDLASRPGHLGRDRGVRTRLAQSRAFTKLVTAVCPQLSEKRLLRRLFNDAQALAAAAEGILAPDEQESVIRPKSANEAEEPWTLADLVCLEELRVLLTGEGPERFRHIVVDEAQNLTPMQVRGLARRCPGGSLTVLGDLAQSTGVHRYRQWSDFTGLLTLRDGWHLHELTVGYRIPHEVMHVAVPSAVAVAPTVRTPAPVRPPEEGDVLVHGFGPDDLVEQALARVERLREDDGPNRSIAVITADGSDLTQGLRSRLAASWGHGGDSPVQALPVSRVNGLEFDHVVLVEPAEITASAANGVGRLYVALTRCTQSLSIVYARPLPDVLIDPDGPSDHAEAGRCARFRGDGHRCRNTTTAPDRWCRQDGCGGYRTRTPVPHGERPERLPFPTGTDRGAAPGRHGDGPAAVRVTAAARARFATRHRSDAREAQVELGVMLAHLWDHGEWSLRRDGSWLLDDRGYRLVLSPDARSVTDYQTVHLERSYAQFVAGVPSRYGLSPVEPTIEQIPPPREPNPLEQTMSSSSESASEAFLSVIRAAVRREREDFDHESLRHQLMADLLKRRRAAQGSEFVDVACQGPEGEYLYEVLGVDGYTYERMREGVLRIMEVGHTTGKKADRAFLVLPRPPEPAEAASMVSAVFGVEVLWRSGETWEGTRVDLALGVEDEASEA